MFVSHRRRQVRHVILTCDVHAMLTCDVIREYKDMCAHTKKYISLTIFKTEMINESANFVAFMYTLLNRYLQQCYSINKTKRKKQYLLFYSFTTAYWENSSGTDILQGYATFSFHTKITKYSSPCTYYHNCGKY